MSADRLAYGLAYVEENGVRRKPTPAEQAYMDAALAESFRQTSEAIAVKGRRPAVTKRMLAAGRAAFTRHRTHLDDLWHPFDCDRDDFIRAIYRAMRKAEETTDATA